MIDPKITTDEQFIQYVGDNVDHNPRTLDGHGIFHGMGMVAITTPGQTISRNVPLCDNSTDDILLAGRIKLHQYNSQRSI